MIKNKRTEKYLDLRIQNLDVIKLFTHGSGRSITFHENYFLNFFGELGIAP